MTLRRTLPLLASLLALGCGNPSDGLFDDVESADRVTLHSLDGLDSGQIAPEGWPKATEKFLHWGSYGGVELDTAGRQKAVSAIRRAVDASDGSAAKCFMPRHALRVENNGIVTDHVLCFECGLLATYRGERETGGATVAEGPYERELDAILAAAGLQLAPKELPGEASPAEATE